MTISIFLCVITVPPSLQDWLKKGISRYLHVLKLLVNVCHSRWLYTSLRECAVRCSSPCPSARPRRDLPPCPSHHPWRAHRVFALHVESIACAGPAPVAQPCALFRWSVRPLSRNSRPHPLFRPCRVRSCLRSRSVTRPDVTCRWSMLRVGCKVVCLGA